MFKATFLGIVLSAGAILPFDVSYADPPPQRESHQIGSSGKDPSQSRSVTLLGMLGEWQYPNSKFNGATSSDAGVSGVPAVKCKAVLTSTDPVQKVIDFYKDKLGIVSDEEKPSKGASAKATVERSVSVQDDSTGRTVKLCVFVVNEKGSSTSLVVSNAEGEKETHIAWFHFQQLGP